MGAAAHALPPLWYTQPHKPHYSTLWGNYCYTFSMPTHDSLTHDSAHPTNACNSAYLYVTNAKAPQLHAHSKNNPLQLAALEGRRVSTATRLAAYTGHGKVAQTAGIENTVPPQPCETP